MSICTQKRSAVFFIIGVAFAANLAIAQSGNPMADALTQCYQFQDAQQASNAAVNAKQQDKDPYLQGAANKPVGGPNPLQTALGQATGNFNCNGEVKGIFDNLLSQGGSMFGIDLGTLLGGVANAEAGNLCNSVNQAIGKTVGGLNLSCPRVNIPGFNNNCGLNVSAGVNGVRVNAGGSLGGYNANTNGTLGTNGGYSANGSASGGTLNNSRVVTNGNVANGTNNTGSTGWFSNASNNVSCWFSGGTGC